MGADGYAYGYGGLNQRLCFSLIVTGRDLSHLSRVNNSLYIIK